MSAELLTLYGLTNVEAISQAAAEAGVPLWIAAAVIEKESGGANVYGNDRGGVYAVGDPERPDPNVVTPQNYARFEERVLAGETSNGVGPAQITWPGFIRDAKERGIRLWDPPENIRYGLGLVAGYLAGQDSDEVLQEAGRRYNGAAAYGADLVVRAATWRERLLEANGMGVSALGWASVTSPGTRRVGPHAAHPDNPREIGFRDHDVADLLAGKMWLVHTGNGGQAPDVPIRQWHGHRPSTAKFGSPNSDHHAAVADDQNWGDPHPWEAAAEVGNVRYNAHMNDARFRAQHALFAAVEARLTVPGQRPVVRWCGRSWMTDTTAQNGRVWQAYAVGHRDCMHWVISTRNRAQIKAAADRLRSWFRPPRTAADVQALQRRVGVKDDGQWGPASVAAMRAEQRRLGVAPTGLPGDVATRAAWAKEDAKPVDPWSLVDAAYVRMVQELLSDVTDNAGKPYYVGAIDGSPGDQTRTATGRFQRAHGLTPDEMAGDQTVAKLRSVLAAQTQAKQAAARAERLGARRVAGVNAESTTALANGWVAPAGKGVLLAARGTPDHHAALAIRDQRPAEISVLLCRNGGALPSPTREEIARVRPAWVYSVGGSTPIPDDTLLAALTAAGIKP